MTDVLDEAVGASPEPARRRTAVEHHDDHASWDVRRTRRYLDLDDWSPTRMVAIHNDAALWPGRVDSGLLIEPATATRAVGVSSAAARSAAAEHLQAVLNLLPIEAIDRITQLGRAQLGDLLLAGTTEEVTREPDLTEYMGPWVSEAAVQRYLGVDVHGINDLLAARGLLGLPFADGRRYFPSRQFADGAVLEALPAVLAALVPLADDPETWAVWLSGRAESTEGPLNSPTMWQLLQEGQADLVIELARRDAAHFAR